METPSLAEVDRELRQHLEREAVRKGMQEPKKSTWVNYMLDLDSRRSLVSRLRSAMPDFDWTGKSCLDVGCGYGNLLVACAEHCGAVAGIEIEADRVEWAKKRSPTADIRAGSAASLPWPDATFDLVLSTDVFEHIDYRTQALAGREIARVLKPGGLLYLAVPNRFQILDEHHFIPFGSWVRGPLRRAYVGLVGRSPYLDVWERTRAGWRSLMRSCGLEEMLPVHIGSSHPIKRLVGSVVPQRTSALYQKPLNC